MFITITNSTRKLFIVFLIGFIVWILMNSEVIETSTGELEKKVSIVVDARAWNT